MTLVSLLAAFYIKAQASPFKCDDAYIAFRFAERLARLGELTYNDGERVEGFTSPLFVLYLATGAKFGASLPVLASRTSVLASLMLLLLVFRSVVQLAPRSIVLPAVTTAAVGASLPILVYATAQLETATYALAVFAALDRAIMKRSVGGTHDGIRQGMIAALAPLLRPEGAVVAGVAFAFVFATRARHKRRFLVAYLCSLAIPVTAWIVFRRLYFGSYFPNTALVKAPDSILELVPSGIEYITWFVHDMSWAIFLALSIVVVAGTMLECAHKESNIIRVLSSWIYVGMAVIVPTVVLIIFVGGDFMDCHRFIHPIVAPAAMVVAASSTQIIGYKWFHRGSLSVALYAALILIAAVHIHRQQGLLTGIRGGELEDRSFRGVMTVRALRRQVYLQHALASYLRARLRRDEWIVTRGAGVVAFETGAPTVDALGLCDEHLARTAPRVAGPVGHRLVAPLRYLLRHRPVVLLLDGGVPNSVPSVPASERWERVGYKWVAARLDDLPGQQSGVTYLPILVRADRAADFAAATRASTEPESPAY